MWFSLSEVRMAAKAPAVFYFFTFVESRTSADMHLPISQHQPTYSVYHLLQRGREALIPFTKTIYFLATPLKNWSTH